MAISTTVALLLVLTFVAVICDAKKTTKKLVAGKSVAVKVARSHTKVSVKLGSRQPRALPALTSTKTGEKSAAETTTPTPDESTTVADIADVLPVPQNGDLATTIFPLAEPEETHGVEPAAPTTEEAEDFEAQADETARQFEQKRGNDFHHRESQQRHQYEHECCSCKDPKVKFEGRFPALIVINNYNRVADESDFVEEVDETKDESPIEEPEQMSEEHPSLKKVDRMYATVVLLGNETLH